MFINGYSVVVDHTGATLTPKLKVRDTVPMTDKGRAVMNQWLRDMFGGEDTGEVLMVNGVVIVGPLTYQKLKEKFLE